MYPTRLYMIESFQDLIKGILISEKVTITSNRIILYLSDGEPKIELITYDMV